MRKIVYIPDPILYKKSKKVTFFDQKLKDLARDMIEIMRVNFGIGISAVQIGELKKIITIEYLSDNEKEEQIPLTILVNPKITNASLETDIIDEGCLSLPHIELPVKRSQKITVIAQDLDGNRFKIRASGLLARIIQHEIDHLNGEVFVDKSTIQFPYAKEPIRIIFFGTPAFALPIIEEIFDNPIFRVVAAVTETDKPSGRGGNIEFNPIKKFALNNKIEIIQPDFLKPKKDGTGQKESADFEKKLSDLKIDACLVAAYGKIIPKNILDIPKYGFINVHPSLLPKYRGATPLQTTILSGDKITGMTIMKMDEGMDTGPILTQTEVEVPPNITYPELSEEMAKIGAELAVITIPRYIIGLIVPIDQDGNGSISPMIKKENGYVDLKKDSPELIERKIRAYNPWPGVYTISYNKIVKIISAHLKNSKLVIDKVKPEGKKEMNYTDYLRGNSPLDENFVDKK